MRMQALLAAIFGSLLSTPALACMCSNGDPPAAFNGAAAVFIGTMLGGSEKFSLPDRDGLSRPVEAGLMQFAVDEVFKGNVNSATQIVIASERDNTCGPFGLERGARYLIYTYGRQTDGKLISGPCTRSAPLDSDSVREDLRFLRNLPPAGSGGTLRGTVYENRRWEGYRPFAGITLQIQGPDGQLITASTDPAGRLEVKGLKPGKYHVAPLYPADHDGGNERQEDEVEIDDLGTADVHFEIFIKGKLLGRVLDQQGQPFNHLRLRLLPVSMVSNPRAWPEYGHPTGPGGNFEVTGLPPGKYLLYMDLDDPSSQLPRRFFYPGTFDVAAAATIELGLAEIKRGIEFRLPSAFRVRIVKGRVTWPDGRPAAGALVALRCARSGVQGGLVLETFASEVNTDDAGRFALDAIASQGYLLDAHAAVDDTDPFAAVYSPGIAIMPGERTLTRDLVLSRGSPQHCDR